MLREKRKHDERELNRLLTFLFTLFRIAEAADRLLAVVVDDDRRNCWLHGPMASTPAASKPNQIMRIKQNTARGTQTSWYPLNAANFRSASHSTICYDVTRRLPVLYPESMLGQSDFDGMLVHGIRRRIHRHQPFRRDLILSRLEVMQIVAAMHRRRNQLNFGDVLSPSFGRAPKATLTSTTLKHERLGAHWRRSICTHTDVVNKTISQKSFIKVNIHFTRKNQRRRE